MNTYLVSVIGTNSSQNLKCSTKGYFHLNNDVITRLKNKLRHTCDKYSRIKVPYKYHNVITNLRRNKQLVILKQDKGRGVVLLNKTKYVEKFFSIINTNKFKKLDKNPTISYEAKIHIARI